MPPTSHPRRTSIIAELTAELLRDPEPLVLELLEGITHSGSPYRYDVEGLEASVRDNVVSILTDLSRERDVTTTFPRRTARQRAEQGVPIESVLHSFGRAFRVIWQRLVEMASARGPDELQQLVRGGTVVWDAIDAYAKVVAKEYRQRVAQLARRVAQDRMATASAILEGRVSEWKLATESARTLGLDPDGRFVVVVADASGVFRALPDLEDRLAGHHVPSAWTPRADGVAGIVAVTRTRPLRHIIDLLTAAGDGPAGISPVVQGLDAVAAVVPLATLARNSLPVAQGGVATFDDRPVACLVASGPEQVTTRLARTVLGGVLDLHPGERDLLLETLEVWFDHGGSITATASSLFCHRNTVRNRLNRVREVTGRDVDDVRHLTELRTALLANRLRTAPGPEVDVGGA